jgi:hypothetical protein
MPLTQLNLLPDFNQSWGYPHALYSHACFPCLLAKNSRRPCIRGSSGCAATAHYDTTLVEIAHCVPTSTRSLQHWFKWDLARKRCGAGGVGDFAMHNSGYKFSCVRVFHMRKRRDAREGGAGRRRDGDRPPGDAPPLLGYIPGRRPAQVPWRPIGPTQHHKGLLGSVENMR